MAGEETLAEKARAERKRHKWTQEELARRSGASLRSISNFENERVTPQPANLRAILRALGMDEHLADAPVAPMPETKAHDDPPELPDCPTCGKIQWPADIQPFLNMLGAWLITKPEHERERQIFSLTRQIFEANNHGG